MWNRPQLLNAIADLVVLAAAAALLAGVVAWLVRVPALPVRQVVFAGELAHTRRAEIEQVLPAALRGNFLSINLETVRAAMMELPWVRRVELRRVWPARIEVKVEEHRVAARWGDGRGELVNTFGEVFAASPEAAELERLPLLFGPPGTAPEVLRRYGDFTESFRPLGERPVEVLLSPRLAWQLRLGNGMRVDIGREQPKSPVALRLQRFIDVYPDLVARRSPRPVAVDLRYPNGFALRAAADAKGK
jgi:cell division protein FtsQ